MKYKTTFYTAIIPIICFSSLIVSDELSSFDSSSSSKQKNHSVEEVATRPSKGFFKCGIPYNRIGDGPRPLVVFNGLMFENKPVPDFMVPPYNFFGTSYTVYVVSRKPGLPAGYTLKDMSDDYAQMIREEFNGSPVNIIALSTGGSIAHYFAVDHPDLINKLIIHSSACKLSDKSKAVQLKVAELAEKKHWIRAYKLVINFAGTKSALERILLAPLISTFSVIAGCFMSPESPSDLIVTIKAEDSFNFEKRLSEIKLPVLVAGGTKDPCYPEELFKKTAEGIPGCKLALYPGKGHAVFCKEFKRDALQFLSD